jgi:hypothetical protein
MSEFDNTEEKKSALAGINVKNAIDEESDGLSSEEILDGKEEIDNVNKTVDKTVKAKSLVNQLALLNDTDFKPENYLSTQLTKEDIFPTLDKSIAVGQISTKTLGSANVYATNAIIPFAALNKRREAIKASIAAQQAKQAKYKELVNSIYYPTTAQFNQEFNDRVFLKNQEWLKRYGNNAQALARDPQWIKEQNDLEQQAKSMTTVHSYVQDVISKVKKGEYVSEEKRQIANEYMSGTGRFEAGTYVDNILNGKAKPSELLAKIQKTETSEAFLKKENLDNFVMKTPVDMRTGKAIESSTNLKGLNTKKGFGYSKTEITSGTIQRIDKNALLDGLKVYVKSHNIEGVGDFNAPTDSKEFKQWVEYSEGIYQAAEKYKYELDINQKVEDNGASQAFRDRLAKSKFDRDTHTYYGDVREMVSNQAEMDNIAKISDPAKRKAAYNDYMKRFPTAKDSKGNDIYGMPVINLGTPVRKDGTWNRNTIGVSVPYQYTDGVGRFRAGRKWLTPAQIVALSKDPGKGKRKGNFLGAYEIPESMVKDAEKLVKYNAGEMEKTNEFATHMVRSGNTGNFIPVTASTGEGAHNKIYTMVGSEGKVILNKVKSAERNPKTGQYDLTPEYSTHAWVNMNNIDEATGRAAMQGEVSAKEQTLETTYE